MPLVKGFNRNQVCPGREGEGEGCRLPLLEGARMRLDWIALDEIGPIRLEMDVHRLTSSIGLYAETPAMMIA